MLTLELRDYTLLTPFTQCMNVRDNILPHMIGIKKLRGLDFTEFRGKGNFRTTHNPVGKVIALCVIPEGFIRYLGQLDLKLVNT